MSVLNYCSKIKNNLSEVQKKFRWPQSSFTPHSVKNFKNQENWNQKICVSFKKTKKQAKYSWEWRCGNLANHFSLSLSFSSLQSFVSFSISFKLSLQNFSSKENYWLVKRRKNLLEICKFGHLPPPPPTPSFPRSK